MILTKSIEIKINNRYVKYYINLGYNVKGGDIINIPIEHLMKTSHMNVDVKCDNCQLEKKISYRRYLLSFNNGDKYLCKKCSHLKTEATIFCKFGVKNIFELNETKEKIKKTNIEKYGVEYPLQNKNIMNKLKKSNINKYGYENVFQNEQIKEKSKITNLEKYGKEYPNQSKNIKDKIKSTTLLLYGVDYAMKNSEISNKSIKNRIPYLINRTLKCFKEDNILSVNFENKIYTLECDCGKNHTYEISNKLLNVRKYNSKTTLCTICNPLKSLTGLENQLYEFISNNYNGKILRNVRKILDNRYEIDIYLPDLNIGFEFNGMYWHNENNKVEEYHKNKFKLCFEKKINLIYIWENDWLNNNKIIKENILNILNDCKKIEKFKIVKNNKNIKIYSNDNIIASAKIDKNIIYDLVSDKNYNLIDLYDYIKNNNYILVLNSYNNILKNNFKLLDVIEKKIFFKSGNYNYYDIDKIYLGAI